MTSRYRLSRLAKRDLHSIAAYTLERWGAEQAAEYLDGFEDLCQLIAAVPRVGRPAEHVRPGLRRHPYGSHVVFYLSDEKGAFIVRVLHARMDVERQFTTDSE